MRDAESLGGVDQGVGQGEVGRRGDTACPPMNVATVPSMGAGGGGDDQVAQADVRARSAPVVPTRIELARAEPQQLLRDDPDGRTAHAGGLDAYRPSVDGPRVAEQEPMVVHQPRALEPAVEAARR